MAVVRHASSGVGSSTTSTVSVAYPTNSVGDILLLSLATYGTPATPAGWTLLGSNTTAPAGIYVYWQYAATVQSGTVTISLTGSTGARAHIDSYTGASSVAPTAVVSTGSASPTTAAAAPSQAYDAFVYWAVSRGTGSSTMSAEASSDGSWVPSETSDSSGGALGMTVVDGPIGQGVTASLSGTSSVAAVYGSVAVALAVPVVTGATGANGLNYGLSAFASSALQPVLAGAVALTYTLAGVASQGSTGFTDNGDGTLTVAGTDSGDGTATIVATDDGDGTAVVTAGTTGATGATGLSFALTGAATSSTIPATGAASLNYALSSVASGTSLPATGTSSLNYALSAAASSKVPPAFFATGASSLNFVLSAVASTQVVVTVKPVGGRTWDMRLVGYTPLGARIGPIPDLGFTINSTASGPTLTAQVSTVIAGSLPQNLEVAVEWWHVSSQQWAEGRDARFAITQVDADDRDRTGTVTITGLGLGAFLLAAAQLNGVDPYADTTGVSEVSRSNTATSVSGTTWTWSGHVLSIGDRVRINSVGNAKGINSGSVYYVINPTTNTFQLARGATSTVAINAGTASNVSMSRVDTRIVFTDSHKFRKNDSVSVLGGGTLGLTDGTQYFVVNPTPSTIQLASQPGGVPIELNHGATNVTQVYRYLDGQRIFTNATPGTVMDAVFGEARNRGWGVNPSDPTQTIVHGWTTAAGADGVPWTKMADDPTTPGISIGFQPGTPGTQVLQALLDNQYAEWYCLNRIIYLVNYGTGTDHTAAGGTAVRIGTTASQVKVQTDLTSMRNAVTVRGTGPILTTQVATGSPWGRLEVYESAQGATSKTLAAKQAATDLAANQNPSVAYTVTENAQEAPWLPWKNFNRGDWVAVQLAGTGWTRLRVVGWSFTKAPSGAITATSNLENIKRALLTKQQKAMVTTSAGLGSTGTPGSTLQESDNRPPTYPLGVTVTTVGFFAADDSAEATATVSWLPVTADQDGGEVQAVQYDVWIRPEGAFNGQSVGRTAGLSLDVTPLGAGRYFEVSVRAQSSTGKWGELSPELEFQTNYPVAVPNPPSTPIVTGKLGSVRVAWDGNLVDPTNGPGAAPNGFAYVYAAYCTTQAGVYIPAGSNMGNAGYTPITGLGVGSTYWFALFAVNTVGVVSAMSPAVQFTVVGVKGPDIEANSVTANTIAAGAITADKLDIGTVPSGTPTNRVPMPLTAATFWGLACSTAPNGVVYSTALGATAGATGITLTAVASNVPHVWITRQQTAPPSRVLHLSGLATAGLAVFQVQEWDSLGGVTSTTATISPAGAIYNLAATTTLYAVALQIPATVSSGTDTIESAAVFEAIGAGGGGQAAQLTPSGLRLFDGYGNLAMDLTTASQQFINIYDNTGAEPVSVATVDSSGNGTFAEVSGTGFDIAGALLTDPTQPASLMNASPNGGGWGPTPLLDIGGHGCVYDTTWDNLDGYVVSTQYQRIAQDVFVLEDGRTYQFAVDLGGLATVNGTNGNIYIELQMKVGSPNTSPSDGTSVSHAVVYTGKSGYWAIPPVTFSASAQQSTVDVVNRLLPANVPIYWQINTNMSATPNVSYTFAAVGLTRGFTVTDIGSSYAVRPAGIDALANVTDHTTSGGSSGTKSGGTVAKTTTKTWRASWSRSWHDSGNTIVTGTGQYTNGASMYQGNGATPMGSQFGFAALGLSGKTITSCQLYMLNAYQAYSGKSALLGTHGNSSPPATYTTSRQNAWNVGWGQGQGKWITVPSSLWSSIVSGSIRGFSLGVDGSNGNYGYWEGATQNYPPLLKISYH